MESMSFFNPKLSGRRFDDHKIPVEILEDFKLYEDLLKKVAKRIYNEQNDRKRVPSGFGDGVSLKLSGVEDGSAIAAIALVASSFMLGDLDTQPYFVQARDMIAKTIDAADRGSSERFIDDECLGYFNKIGKRLKDDEAIEFAPNSTHTAKLTNVSRRRLVMASGEADSFEQEAIIRGVISGYEKEDKICNVKFGKTLKIEVKISPDNEHLFKEAYDGYDDRKKVKIEGIGSYNRHGKLVSMSVESITILDKMDIPARLEEFLLLEKGWLDGEGEDFKQEDINWLISQTDSRLPNNILLPFAFPTPDGEVQFEWKIREHDLTAYINLQDKKAYIYYLNTLTDDEVEYNDVDLSLDGGWAILLSELNKYFKID